MRLLFLTIISAAMLLPRHASAGSINYDQVPADTVGYVHVDVEGLLKSTFAQQLARATGQDLAEISRGLKMSGITVCSLGGRSQGVAMLLQLRDPAASTELVARTKAVPDAITITYNGREVYYTPGHSPLLDLFTSFLPDASGNQPPTTRSAERSDAKDGFALLLDLQGAAGEAAKYDPTRSPSYTSALQGNLVVSTSDLGSLAIALDTIAGTKPSLAKQDPMGLKADLHEGIVIVGAGLTLSFRGSDVAVPRHTQTTRPRDEALGFDLFGAFNGKTRVTRFVLREKDAAIGVDVGVTMVDPAAAEQLKNLVLGVKSIVYLSQHDYRDLISPLDVQTAADRVNLHWSYPTGKLVNLLSAIVGFSDDQSHPTTTPAPAAN